MSTQTEQRYVVHVDIKATALDASGAVENALKQLLLGDRDDFAFRVEEVGDGAQSAALPTQRLSSVVALLDRAQRDNSRKQHHRYPNEFLG